MINSVVFTGHLTKDPELRKTKDGVSVIEFALAVNRPNSSKIVDFINVVAWRQKAEFICRNFSKGGGMGITGQLQQRRWQSEDGKQRSKLEVMVSSVSFCGNPKPEEKEPEAPEESEGLEGWEVGFDD